MSDEREIQAWLTESAAQFGTLSVGITPSAQEIRRLGGRRRNRRTFSLAVAAIAVAFGASSYVTMRVEKAAVNPATPVTNTVKKARATLQAYYSALPDAVALQEKDMALTKLMAEYFSPSALRGEVSAGQGEDGHPAAVCEAVTARTVFTVGDLYSVDTDTARADVTSSSGAGPVDVTFDLRTMRISKWVCPQKSGVAPPTVPSTANNLPASSAVSGSPSPPVTETRATGITSPDS